MQGPIDIQLDREQETAILYVAGPVNAMHSPRLREVIANQFEEAKSIVVDLADVTYMDSSGLATLVEGVQLADQQKKKFVLSRIHHERVKHLMEITRLTELFEVFPSVTEAVEAAR